METGSMLPTGVVQTGRISLSGQTLTPCRWMKPWIFHGDRKFQAKHVNADMTAILQLLPHLHWKLIRLEVIVTSSSFSSQLKRPVTARSNAGPGWGSKRSISRTDITI